MRPNFNFREGKEEEAGLLAVLCYTIAEMLAEASTAQLAFFKKRRTYNPEFRVCAATQRAARPVFFFSRLRKDEEGIFFSFLLRFFEADLPSPDPTNNAKSKKRNIVQNGKEAN